MATLLLETRITELDALEDYECQFFRKDYNSVLDSMSLDLFEDIDADVPEPVLEDIDNASEDELRCWLLNFYSTAELNNFAKSGFTLRELAEHQQIMGYSPE